MRTSTLLLLLGWLCVSNCARERAFVVLTVEDPLGVAAAYESIAAGLTPDRMTSMTPDRQVFPVSVTVTASAAKTRTVWVEARDDAGEALGRGVVVARFAVQGYPAATVQLGRACADDGDCANDSFCDGVETCVDGICPLGPVPLPCGSEVACVTSSCVEEGGGAGHCSVLVDHSVCGADAYCNPSGGCLPGQGCYDDVECGDGYLCNGVERCVNYLCVAGDLPVLDDGDPCTVSGCNETEGIFHVAVLGLDGNRCEKVGAEREICLAAHGGCVVSTCGDGFVDIGTEPPETCDEGERNSSDWSLWPHCNATCDGVAPHCGDGVVDVAENCDDGNTQSDGNDCSAQCQCEGIGCATLSWQGVGGSDFGPRDIYTTWGSTRCSGLGIASRSLGTLSAAHFVWLREGNGPVAMLTDVVDDGGKSFQVRSWDGLGFVVQQAFPYPPLGMLPGNGSILKQLRWWGAAPSHVAQPLLAWSNGSNVFVGRWNGAMWAEEGTGSLGATGISAGASGEVGLAPLIVSGASDNIVVLWRTGSVSSNRMYLRHYDGISWKELGAGSATGDGWAGVMTNTSYDDNALVLDSQARPIVAWCPSVGGAAEVYVKRWNGSAWQEVGTGSASGGGISASAGASTDVALVFDAAGTLYAAWSEATSEDTEIYVKRWNGSTWSEVGAGSASAGGISNDAVASMAPILMLSHDGLPMVLWNSGVDGVSQALMARRFDGGTWVELDAGAATGAGIVRVGRSIAAMGDESDLHVAWTDLQQDDSWVAGYRHDAGGWHGYQAATATVSTALATPNPSGAPTLALDANGRPVVAWLETLPTGVRVYAKRFDGSQWVEMGSGSASGDGLSGAVGTATGLQLAVDPMGRPIVIWGRVVSYKLGELCVGRFENDVWTSLNGGSVTGCGLNVESDNDTMPGLAFTDDGRPVVAWADYSWNYNGDIYVRVWSGSTWEEWSAGSASNGGITGGHGNLWRDRIALTVDAMNRPVVAWSDTIAEDIYVLAWDGVGWSELGVGSASGYGVSNSGGEPLGVRLVSASDGAIYLAWMDDFLGSTSVYVWQWDGHGWSLLAPGDSAAGSMNPPDHVAAAPALALDSLDRPFVAWEQAPTATSVQREIALRRWNRADWVDVGASSATAGAISNADCGSSAPALAVGDARACVAWVEHGMVSADIVVRCGFW